MKLNNVIVRWKDAFYVEQPLSVKDIEEQKDYTFYTCGFLVEKKKNYVVVAKTFDERTEKFRYLEFIPTSLIISINGEKP